MNLFFRFLVTLFIPLVAFAGPSDVKRQGEPFNNLLIDVNPGFENGLVRWTSSGGTFTKNTTLSNVSRGVASGAWDSSSTGQTLTSRQVSIPSGLYNQECVASVWVKGGDTNLSFKVIDGSLATVGNSVPFIQAYSSYVRLTSQFKCPSSGTLALQLASTGNAAVVYVDEAFLGQKDTTYVSLDTDWLAADTGSITLQGITVSSWLFYQYRYVGDSMDIQLEATVGSSSGSEARIGLPDGAVINGTVIPNTSFAYVGDVSNDQLGTEALVIASGSKSYLNFAESGGKYTTPVSGTTLATTGWTLSIRARVPVVNRSSNVQLAKRALVEYASNSSVSDADDTTSFAFGPTGSPFPNTLSTFRRKRVRFPTPIQPTDVIRLERSTDGINWVDFSGGGENGAISIYPYNGATENGAALELPPINATDINILFRQYSSGTSNWSASAGFYRVSKTASGASVGYPIGSRNLIQTVPTSSLDSPGPGFLGYSAETQVSSAVNAAASASFKELASITLQPGKYIIYAAADLLQNGATLVATGEMQACVGLVSASSSGCVEGISLSRVLIPTAHISDYHNTLVVARPPLIVTTPTTVYFNTRVDYSSGTPQWRGHIYALAVN